MPQPLKRHKALRTLSHEHYEGLSFLWHVNIGLEKGVPIERIGAYAQWFWEQHLAQHFSKEEQYLFPLLPPEDPSLQQALTEHRALNRLFEARPFSKPTLHELVNTLKAYIRFEERELFEKMQAQADEAALQAALAPAASNTTTPYHDLFWQY